MKRILIVDDDLDLAEGQALFLEQHGYTVETAASMEEGMEKISRVKPDLILVDLMMEEYDSGLVFCRRVRNTPVSAHTPIVMQTAASQEIGFGLPSGPGEGPWLMADAVLAKPVSLEQLLETVEQHLRGDSDE
jgi:CheY-like chemotaxis protein